MKRFSFAPLWLISAAVLTTGCDISVHTFAGAYLQLTITGGAPTPANQHLELWARTQYDDIVRIDHVYVDEQQPSPAGEDPRRRYGFVIRNAVSMGDPCLIDENTGVRLGDPAAYTPTVVAGVMQDAAAQAAS